MSDIEIGVVTEWAALDSLADDWRRLGADRHVFLDYDWQMTWRGQFAAATQPRVAVFRQGGTVLGIVPMIVQRNRWRRWPVRQLSFWVNDHCPWGGALGAEDTRDLALRLWEHLVARGDWDLARLEGVPEGEPFGGAIQRAAGAVGLGCLRSEVRAHFLPLADNWQEFLAARSGNFRKKLKRSHERLARLGEIQWCAYTTPEDVAEGLKHLFDVDAASWRSDEGEVIRENESLSRYYLHLAQLFAGRNQCWINVLFLNDRAVSAVLSFIHGRQAYGVKTSYLAELAANATSPGFVTVCQALQDAVSRGARHYHFLSAAPSWSHFGGQQETVTSQVSYHPSLYGRLLSMQEKALRRARVVADNYRVEERV